MTNKKRLNIYFTRVVWGRQNLTARPIFRSPKFICVPAGVCPSDRMRLQARIV